MHLPEIQITQAPIQEDSSLKQLDKDENEEQNTEAEVEKEDQEIRLKEQKTDLSDIEDFNLSQLQIKDHYFDDNLEEHLDKKISSAKKEFFEISESDRDLHQYGDMKDPEEDVAEPKQFLDNSELDKEAENSKWNRHLQLIGTEPEAIEKENETTEPKIEETKEEILLKMDEGSEVKDTENKNDQNSITNEDNKNLEALEKPENSDSNEVNNESQPQALNTEEMLKPWDKEAVEDLQKADLSSAAHSAVEQKSEVNPADIGHDDHKGLEKQESQNTEEDEEELMLPAKPTHILPGEKEAWVGASTYNLDNLDELGGDNNKSLPPPFEEKKSSMFMKKPSFKPKKKIVEPQKLDEDLGMLNLTKDEAERRLSEYVSAMIMNKLKSPKWESKVIGVQWLQEWLITNKVPTDLTEYAFRLLKGVMKEWKETNSNLTKAASEWIANVLRESGKMGRRTTAIIIPYLWEKLTDMLVKDTALESVLLWAELNKKSLGKLNVQTSV